MDGRVRQFLRQVIFSTCYFIIAVLVLVPFAIWCFLIRASAKLFQPRLGKMLRGWEPIFAVGPQVDPMFSIPILMTVEGHVDVDALTRLFSTLIDKKEWDGRQPYEKLKQRIRMWCGYAFFEEIQDFRVQNHINFVEDMITLAEGSQTEFMQKYLRTPFANNALWSVHLQYTEENTFVLMRFQHVLGDGASLLNIPQNLETISAGQKPVRSTYVDHYEVERVGWRTKFLETILALAILPEALRQVDQIRGSLKFRTPMPKPGSLFRKFYLCSNLHLSEMKKSKQELQTTMTSIFNHCLNKALELHFNSQLSESEHSPGDFDYITTMISFPRDRRTKLVNENSFGIHRLPRFPLRQRLAAGKEDQKWLMQIPYAKTVFTCVKLFSCLPPNLLRLFVHYFLVSSIPIIVSNLPGPSTPVLLGEKTILDCYVWVPELSPGICVTMFGYNGKIHVAFKGDTGTFAQEEDFRAFVRNFENCITCLTRGRNESE